MRLKFLIYYADHSVFEGKTLDDWKSAPDDGVIVIVEFYKRTYSASNRHTKQSYAGTDYYWMLENGSIEHGSAKQIPDRSYIKAGQLISDAEYLEIYNKALAC